MYSERAKANADIREKESKEFNDLLKGAADAAAPVAQRVPLIWALHGYWDSEHELVLANALSALIANDKDRAVLESAAEVIGHAYESDTVVPVQERLRKLLYGTASGSNDSESGKVGAVLRAENLIYDRYKADSLDLSLCPDQKDQMDKLYKLRMFYIAEAVRKNWKNLNEVNLERDFLQRILLYGAYLNKANLIDADLRGGRLFGTHFDGAKMVRTHLEGADLHDATFVGAKLMDSHMEPPDTKDIPIEPDHLPVTNLDGADFSGADLTKAHLRGAYLVNAKFARSTLEGADLEGALVFANTLQNFQGKYVGTPKVISPEEWSSIKLNLAPYKQRGDMQTPTPPTYFPR
jgi:uncharacterized protein YjbI with pentapeptide repeats